MKKIMCGLLIGIVMTSLWATEKSVSEKNITIIQGQTSADGKTNVSESLLEECIESLPDPSSLEPIITSEAKYLKEINGDPNKNDFVRTYTATLEINYMLKQKTLVVVTVNAVQAQEPVMKVIDKSLKQTKVFTSDPSNGDIYAGRSRRQYYFSTPEAAAKDVKEKAAAWIKQQQAVICSKK